MRSSHRDHTLTSSEAGLARLGKHNDAHPRERTTPVRLVETKLDDLGATTLYGE